MQLTEFEAISLMSDSPYDEAVRELQDHLESFGGDIYAVLGAHVYNREQPDSLLHRVDRHTLSKEGKRYFTRVRAEIGQVVCGKAYEGDRAGMKALVIGMMPSLLARLELPVEAAGIAALCLIIVFKMGTRSFCASLGIGQSQ